MFVNVSFILVRHNLSIIPPVKHYFDHNTLVSRVTPESIILHFSSVIRQTVESRADRSTERGHLSLNAGAVNHQLLPSTALLSFKAC